MSVTSTYCYMLEPSICKTSNQVRDGIYTHFNLLRYLQQPGQSKMLICGKSAMSSPSHCKYQSHCRATHKNTVTTHIYLGVILADWYLMMALSSSRVSRIWWPWILKRCECSRRWIHCVSCVEFYHSYPSTCLN